MNLNSSHHHIQPEKQDAMYHFSNHPMYQNIYPQQCPVFLGHPKHSTIIGPPHNTQIPLHNNQVNIHSIHSNEHINQVNTHNTQSATHNFQAPAHTMQISAHNIQVSVHNTPPTQVIAHNTQVNTHNTQSVAYNNIEAPAHNTQATTHNASVTVYNSQVVTHNTPTVVHNIQSSMHNPQPIHTIEHAAQNKFEVIQQHTTPVEVMDTEKPKCLVKDELKVDSQKDSSKPPAEHVDTETPKFLVKVEVKAIPEKVLSKLEKKQKAVGKSKNSVDTSHFTIEERLIAAVWVHERKIIKKSMRQLKHDFHQRFGRKAPAKNTLLGWERKLFSTGCLEDAPRTGRPVKRRSRVEEVAASIRSAPSLSLRARALALRVPTTTLHTILRRDLAVSQVPQVPDDKSPTTKKNTKKAKPAKRKPSLPEQGALQGPPAACGGGGDTQINTNVN